jgi:hypothetical protein
MLRLELLQVKADLERELEDFVLDCTKCGLGRALGERSRRSTRTLGAPGASAARRAGGLAIRQTPPLIRKTEALLRLGPCRRRSSWYARSP